MIYLIIINLFHFTNIFVTKYGSKYINYLIHLELKIKLCYNLYSKNSIRLCSSVVRAGDS